MEEKYTLKDLYNTLLSFKTALDTGVASQGLMFSTDYNNSPIGTLIANSIYNYFYDDYVKYYGDNASTNFMNRLSYDIAVKFPYWKTKYNYILKLFTPDQLNLLQTSRMISESHEDVKSAGGVIQKSANTPTAVNTSSTSTGDNLEITTTPSSTTTSETLEVDVGSDSFADKYTNYQGKTTTGSKTQGDRSGDVMREGSIKELLEVLEKLPSSFTDEILKEVSKHFEVVYSY